MKVKREDDEMDDKPAAVRRAASLARDERQRGQGYSVKAKAGVGEILIYEEIDEMFGVGAKQFASDLKGLGDLKTLHVRINSPGGNVFDASAMYTQLRRHPAKVLVDVDGMALSAASVVAMAGDQITMAENALMMIHDPWGVAAGNAAEMRSAAEMLDKIAGSLADTYANRTKRPRDQILEMMAVETWFTAQEAVDAGFADRVDLPLQVAAHFDMTAWMARYRHPPQAAAEKVDAPRLRAFEQKFAALDMVAARLQKKSGAATD